MNSNNDAISTDAEAPNTKPNRYYGVSAAFLMTCNIIYIFPHLEHYAMGGMQGSILLAILCVFMLVVDLVLLFILAAILRRVMRKSWAKWVQRIGLGDFSCYQSVPRDIAAAIPAGHD